MTAGEALAKMILANEDEKLKAMEEFEATTKAFFGDMLVDFKMETGVRTAKGNEKC